MAEQANGKEEEGAGSEFSKVKEKVLEKKERLVESYNVRCDEVEVEIRIVIKNFKHTYKVIVPEVSIATSALLDDIKEKLIGAIEVNPTEIFDTKLMDELKTELKDDAAVLLSEELPDLGEKTKNQFILDLMNDLLGLGNIEIFLNDDQIEEIVINSAKEPVRVYHKKYGWLESNITLKSEAQISNYANIIARRIGREITTLNPLLDAHLMTKDRANAILTPISTKGNTVTIRKFARDPWTAPDFIKNRTASSEVLALIWLCIQYEMNILISGGTGSGKTSLLNVCMPFMPPNHRIISIEDTRELQLPKFLYWCPLTTRPANPEGKGEVTMLDLVVNSLRMRPDRIIMGEIRKQREAEVLFEAMHTGHSVYGTLHADTCAQTITRLVNPPINIPESMLDSVHLNVVMFRDRRLGVRRIFEVGEFLEEIDPNTRRLHFNPSILYRWDPRTDDIVPVEKSGIRLYEKIGSHTGLSADEIRADIDLKKRILDWLVEHNTRSIEEMGTVMNRYYVDRNTVIDMVEKNQDPKGLFE
ncbi:MAG: CpaF family protein [Candidatus Altiarchaeota archaeon]|nr:CpaF family protein [Candidatus Altiarchaeota archaeon]